jgi:hypothetical protein
MELDSIESNLTVTCSFRETALELRAGALYFGMETFRIASRDRLLPAALEDQLQRVLLRVKKNLEVAQHSLDYVNDIPILGKVRYTFWRGRGSQYQLDRALKGLKNACDEVARLHLQFSSVSNTRSSHLLTPGIFKLFYETASCDPSKRLPNSDIVVAQGNRSLNHEHMKGTFILERKTAHDEDDLRFLSARLSEPGKSTGVLPLLGYRRPVYQGSGYKNAFDLVFQLPSGHEYGSLANHIVTTPIPDIVERLRLCHAISEAVSNVHALGLVHKAIRTRDILMLTDVSVQNPGYCMYLQDWSRIRELSATTSLCGNDDNWPKRIYQHPKRQSTMVDEAYEPRHDIYSLGVCMLEILLWTPFVVEKASVNCGLEYGICQIFETRGLALGKQRVALQDGGLPARYRGIASKLADNARATCAIWKDIAKTSLQDGEAQVVRGCLEEQFGSASEVSAVLRTIIQERD